MNKRINELMDQSVETRIDIFSNEEYNAFSREKFAELLLKDAARFVDSQTSDNGYGVADGWCRGQDLLKHFGIES